MPDFSKQKTKQWIKEVVLSYNKKIGELNFIFTSDEKILEVNRTYLQHDYYTDVITFDYSEDQKISGDIFISLDTVKTNAEKYSQTFDNELYRVIIHGVLHLVGYQDHSDEDRAQMRKLENKALLQLN
ncbi:MAG: rRNA maturation RNase YbeY [Bacteroidales bacterium]|nr:rRNA maturation RNase YbeY [Bacteroidales bacterium]